MRITGYSKSNMVRSGLLLVAGLLAAESAHAEVTLAESDGWTFFADGRINLFLSSGFGDGFPEPIPPPVDAAGNPTRPEYSISGGEQGWTGYKATTLEDTDGNYSALRARSGFLGTIFGFGLKRDIGGDTTAKGYFGLWTDAESLNRDRVNRPPLAVTDVRQGYVSFSAPWGTVLAGRDGGIFGSTSTEIDFLYGHNFGLGLPCMDYAGNPGCGHVGTGVMGNGVGAGFTYTTPSLGGVQLKAGLYDPVRLLGGWDKARILRPEGQLSYQTPVGADGMLKLAVEGVWQQLSDIKDQDGPNEEDVNTSIWGVAGGARGEFGPVRLGLAAFHGRGLGFYTALQNDPVVFDLEEKPGELRTFTGYYGQGALVFGPVQFSAGAGVAIVHQLEKDKVNPSFSTPESQTGVSAAVYYSVSDNVVVGLDYFRFMVRWRGARNSHYDVDAMGNPVLDETGNFAVAVDPGVITEDKQDMNFVNAGVTFHW